MNFDIHLINNHLKFFPLKQDCNTCS